MTHAQQMVLHDGPDHLEPLPLQAQVDDTHRRRSRVPDLDRQHVANLVLPVLEDRRGEPVAGVRVGVGVGDRGRRGVERHLDVRGVGRVAARTGAEQHRRDQGDGDDTAHLTTG